MPEVTDVFPNCLPCCGGGSVCHNGAIWFNPASHASPGVCPNELDNTKKVCLHFELTHNIKLPSAQWVPPSPVGCDYYADCQNLLKPQDSNVFWAMPETSPVHPEYSFPKTFIFGAVGSGIINNFEVIYRSTNPVGCLIANHLLVPRELGYRYSLPTGGFTTGTTYRIGTPDPDSVLGGNLTGTFSCGPFTWTSDPFDIYTDFVNYGEYKVFNVVGRGTIKITKTLCSTVVPIIKAFSPVSAPVVSQATKPCKHIGDNIEDPATCGCGTAVLRHCSIYGACRVTGTSTAGEGICLTCPSYQAP
jgi:hypothetical protein